MLPLKSHITPWLLLTLILIVSEFACILHLQTSAYCLYTLAAVCISFFNSTPTSQTGCCSAFSINGGLLLWILSVFLFSLFFVVIRSFLSQLVDDVAPCHTVCWATPTRGKEVRVTKTEEQAFLFRLVDDVAPCHTACWATPTRGKEV
jgi:hypothetical protein